MSSPGVVTQSFSINKDHSKQDLRYCASRPIVRHARYKRGEILQINKAIMNG